MMLRLSLPLALAIALPLLLAAGPTSSPTTTPASQPTVVDEATTSKLVEKLGDEDWKVREAASKDLLKLGEAARDPLERAASKSANPELKLRAENLLTTLNRPEVDVVGVYEPGGQHFRMIGMRGQDIEWAKFCDAVAEQAKLDHPNPGKRLWERLPETSREIVADKDQVQRIDNLVNRVEGGRYDRQAQRNLRQLTTALDEALRRPDFFDEAAFAGVTLDDETKELMKRPKLSALERTVLNRKLFEAAFPGVIDPLTFKIERATVPVHVAATSRPIILVLCSYECARWEIQPDEGAKIVRVIVGGYHAQDVTGTSAPVDYHVYEMPTQVEGGPRWFYAYEEDGESYTQIADAIRKLTGEPIATFQGRYSYEGGPAFVVKNKE